jgi:two-component system chemotaxis response regulator CheB
MAHCPTPILVVSSSTNRGELFRTYEALAAGALDVVEKPRGDASDTEWEEKLVGAVKLVSRIKVITHPRGRLRALMAPEARPAPLRGRGGTGLHVPRVLALGASTGGPAALVEVLQGMPAPFPLPILVVIHIGEPFGSAFADWLDGQTSHRVAYAQNGEMLPGPGRVVLAPPDRHLVAREGRLWTTDGPERHSCRPSVDVLFESLAREFRGQVGAALLTGMGRDGAAGLLEVRGAGGATIAQDEATSVVYGMPREAVILGAAEQVLPIGEIGPALSSLAGLER